ncbi:MAG: hypothetical protein PVI03_02505 [Candidatus Thorarchaeota archaeon]
MAQEDRLDRIESKVDTLVEAMTRMVRFEEKIANHQQGMERFGFRLDDIEGRVEVIEKLVPVYNMWTSWANKVAFIIISALTLAILGIVIS